MSHLSVPLLLSGLTGFYLAMSVLNYNSAAVDVVGTVHAGGPLAGRFDRALGRAAPLLGPGSAGTRGVPSCLHRTFSISYRS